jgi:hypothetical protein
MRRTKACKIYYNAMFHLIYKILAKTKYYEERQKKNEFCAKYKGIRLILMVVVANDF